jgi:extradiol dioxygenase family protein
MEKISPFHLAIPVTNLAKCRKFYNEIMQCKEGRSDSHWVDFDFYGHQLVIHQVAQKENHDDVDHNPVDGHEVPVPHFGVVLDWSEWHELAERLQKQNIQFIIEPYIRFQGQPGEQATMFFKDPSGNALEFKSFKDIANLFAK